MRVVGVDPGQTTGLFVVVGETIAHFQERGFAAMNRFVYILDQWHVDDVVIEKFNVFEGRTRMAARDIQWPLDILGAVRWECFKRGIPLAERYNSQKNKVTDDVLAERGWLCTPRSRWDHANDAARHVYGWSATR